MDHHSTRSGTSSYPAIDSQSSVVEVRELSRSFGSKLALDAVSLTVPRGCVFGIVGENGAGKTTLIRHVLGSLKPQKGVVRVFGQDPIARLQKVLARIGYLSASPDLPKWMRIGQLVRYTSAFYPTWDDRYAMELVDLFELDLHAKIKSLSTGQHARVGLVLALAHRPELLLLDEPSSGLDPVVRRDILEAIISSIAEAGCTVIFSSHLLDEVERVSDYLALMQDGQVVECGKLETIQATYKTITLNFEEVQPIPPTSPSAIAWNGDGREWTAVCREVSSDLIEQVTLVGGRIVEQTTPSLDEIFLAYANRERHHPEPTGRMYSR